MLSVALSTQDLDSIKIAGVGIYPQSTYLSLAELTATDMNGNPIQRTETASELQVSALTADSTDPSLSSYELDLNTGLLALIFSETVRASSFAPSLVTLQSDQFGTEASLSLSEGVLLDGDGPILRLQLSIGDLNRLKISTVARAMFSTYLSFPNSLVQDSTGNSISAIQSTLALPVGTYVSDDTSPEVSIIIIL